MIHVRHSAPESTTTRRTVDLPRGPFAGTVVEVDAAGVAFVIAPGVINQPTAARTTVQISRSRLSESPQCEVLLVLERAQPTSPIIIGLIQCAFVAPEESVASAAPPPVATLPDELVLEGRSGVTLRSGKGSISIRKDGKILIRGTNIVSRAAFANKIKGGSVQIN